MKTIWKNLASRIWLIVTAIVLVLIIAINVFACNIYYYAVCQVLGIPTTEIIGEESSNYEKDFADKAAALANGNKVSKEVCEEGFTLLKNADALPLKDSESKVSVFGKNSVDMAIGGSGSGGSVGAKATTIFDSLTANGFTYNQTLVDFYNDSARSGAGRDSNPTDLDSGNAVALSEGETPLTSYSADVWNSCENFKDVALIVITRIGGEGFDMPRNADGTHFLQLSQNEKDLIDRVKTMGFGKVVLVLNTAATLELKAVNDDPDIDAILWVGFAGGNGMTAFGEVLKGKTLEGTQFSPSGKTVDTYAADFTHNPAWENFGSALGGDSYTQEGGKKGDIDLGAYFVDYEESIYVGYRFYETAYAEALNGNKTMGGYNFDYDAEVVYPFGYGLSYTKFDWSLENADELNDKVLTDKTSLTFKVKVTNSGDYPGRDVVQLYVTPQYYAGGIEKSAKLLVGFAKTSLLAAGASETVEITVDSPYAFASYDYKDANKNNFKGYEVEHGTYTFALSTDAHSEVIKVNTSVAEDIKYENDPVTGTPVTNRYTDQSDASLNSDRELGSVLSRNSWATTWPARRTTEERRVAVSDYVLQGQSNPNRPAAEDEMPTTGKNSGIILGQLTGLDYDDEMWDTFLDQLTYDEMKELFNFGAFRTSNIARLGVPETICADGPVGFCNFVGSSAIYNTCVYPCEVVLASTWSVERLFDMGLAVGNEGLIGDENHGNMPYTGWYAPGLNIHRTPFGGRNFEYYSEDSFLNGKLTAAVMKGAAEKGVYVDMKHFALNDQETHRSALGVLTWATEQSMREIYLKAFEIAIKTAQEEGVKAMGVMSSFNRIGERWTGGDYRLLTNILREEWGFEGLVICDFNTVSYMQVKDMVYAGGDLNLQFEGKYVYSGDAKNASDVTVMRQAAKNVLYNVANSNAMRGEFKINKPVWEITVYVLDGVIPVCLLVWGAVVIIRAFRKKDSE